MRVWSFATTRKDELEFKLPKEILIAAPNITEALAEYWRFIREKAMVEINPEDSSPRNIVDRGPIQVVKMPGQEAVSEEDWQCPE